jgi:uncharacterized protein YndB with AHSA1/START domain
MDPDIDSAPSNASYALDVVQVVSVSATRVYQAFTDQLDQWFAASGTLAITPEPGGLYRFETVMEGQRHPHYGRFLELDPGKRVRMAWMTGDPGTQGAETIVTIDIAETEGGTRVRIRQSGFYDEASRDGHEDAWPLVLAHLETTLGGG